MHHFSAHYRNIFTLFASLGRVLKSRTEANKKLHEGLQDRSQKNHLSECFWCLVAKVRSALSGAPGWSQTWSPESPWTLQRNHPKSTQINKMGSRIRLASCLVDVATNLSKCVGSNLSERWHFCGVWSSFVPNVVICVIYNERATHG